MSWGRSRIVTRAPRLFRAYRTLCDSCTVRVAEWLATTWSRHWHERRQADVQSVADVAAVLKVQQPARKAHVVLRTVDVKAEAQRGPRAARCLDAATTGP